MAGDDLHQVYTKSNSLPWLFIPSCWPHLMKESRMVPRGTGDRSMQDYTKWGECRRGKTQIKEECFATHHIGKRRRQWLPTPVLLPGKSHGRRSLAGCSYGVAKNRTRLSDFTFTFRFHALEKEMATHSSVLAWRIPGTKEPGGLPSMGSHRVGHDWSDFAAAAAAAVK